DDDWWRIKRHLGLRRLRRRGPRWMEALGGLRQPAVGRRFDFKTPVARQATSARVVMSDVWRGIEVAAAIDPGLNLPALAKTPLALYDRVGCVDAVNDDGHARPTRNHDIEAAAGKSGQRRFDQNRECYANAHRSGAPI